MSAPETPFTDKNATERGLRIAQQRAPLFAAHIEQIRENMFKTAEECARQGFHNSAHAMTRFANDL